MVFQAILGYGLFDFCPPFTTFFDLFALKFILAVVFGMAL